jgi:hypothetical protein
LAAYKGAKTKPLPRNFQQNTSDHFLKIPTTLILSGFCKVQKASFVILVVLL